MSTTIAINQFGLQDIQQNILQPYWVANQLQVCLYSNDYTPTYASNILDFTEAAYAGYARLPVAPISLTDLGAGVWQLAFSSAAFGPSLASGEAEFGVFLVSFDGRLFGAARFDTAPITVDTSNGIIVNLLLSDLNCAD